MSRPVRMRHLVVDPFYDPLHVSDGLTVRRWRGMSATETGMLQEWLTWRGKDYDRAQVNVHFPCGLPAAVETSQPLVRMWIQATCHRADLIAWRGRGATIVEAKVVIHPRGLEQLLDYRSLLLEQQPGVHVEALVIVGRSISPDVLDVYEKAGVRVDLLGGMGFPGVRSSRCGGRGV